MLSIFRFFLVVLGTPCLLSLATVTLAGDPHEAHRQALDDPSPSSDSSMTSVTLPEVELVDQHGNRASVKDFLEGRTLVVDFIFTRCRTICPVLTTTLKRTQESIPEADRSAIWFVSISVDPTNDTPSALKAYSRKMNAEENWLWLTGSSGAIKRVLRAFGSPTGGRPEDHPPMILVGNTDEEQWHRWVGIPPTEALATTALDMSRKEDKVEHHAQGH